MRGGLVPGADTIAIELLDVESDDTPEVLATEGTKEPVVAWPVNVGIPLVIRLLESELKKGWESDVGTVDSVITWLEGGG